MKPPTSTTVDAYSAAFAWIAGAKSIYRGRGAEVIDLGVADSFTMPPDVLIQGLQRSGAALDDHAYGFHALSSFNDAALIYLQKLFGLHSTADLEVINTAGAKGGLNLVAQTFVQAGDLVLTTAPGYPIFDVAAARLGAEVLPLPLQEGSRFLPDLESLDPAVLRRAKLLAINYPNNPTGCTLQPQTVRGLLELCGKYDILLINDAVYAPITFDRTARLSLLQFADAPQRCIEVHSLSKAFQIPGWRIGFVATHERLAARMRPVAARLDSGQPPFIQRSVIPVLREPDYVETLCSLVYTRLQRLANILAKHGFQATLPAGTFFLYCRAPRADGPDRVFASAHDCALHIAERYGIICIPWTTGDRQYLRFSAAFRSDADDEAVYREIDRRLRDSALLFSH
jgi:LL-diaminopimelate aminotransferase